jgi:hypothetical protein
MDSAQSPVNALESNQATTSAAPPAPQVGTDPSPPPAVRRSFVSKLFGELMNGLFVLLIVLPLAGAALYFLTSEPSAAGPEFEVSNECKYLAPDATQCWRHLRIVSLNDDPITIKDVVVNGRKECTPDIGAQGFAALSASRLINVTNKTIKKGDAYGRRSDMRAGRRGSRDG